MFLFYLLLSFSVFFSFSVLIMLLPSMNMLFGLNYVKMSTFIAEREGIDLCNMKTKKSWLPFSSDPMCLLYIVFNHSHCLDLF